MQAGMLEHERLEVYSVALDFLVVSDAIAASLPRGRSYLADQLRRAAASIALNIAEGAGEFAPDEKVRFYRMARRSGNECAAIIDAARLLAIAAAPATHNARELLVRVISMLTAMILSLRRAGPR